MRKVPIAIVLFALAVSAAFAGFEWKFWYETAVPNNPYAIRTNPPLTRPWHKDRNAIFDLCTDGVGHTGVGYAVRIWPDYPRPCSNWVDVESLVTYICPPPTDGYWYEFKLFENKLNGGGTDMGIPDLNAPLHYFDKFGNDDGEVPGMPFEAQIGDIWHKAHVPHDPVTGDKFMYRDQKNNPGFWVVVRTTQPASSQIFHWKDAAGAPYASNLNSARLLWNGGIVATREELIGAPRQRDGDVIIAAMVSKHHYECTPILAPTGNIRKGSTVTPRARLTNKKPFPAGYPQDYGSVRLWIKPIGGGSAVYDQTLTNYALPVTGSNTATFPNWTADVDPGQYKVRCTLNLWYDWSHINKICSTTITVYTVDFASKGLLAPSGTYYQNTVITPRAEFENLGSVKTTFQARFWIEGTSYDVTKTVANLAPGATVAVDFDQYVASAQGRFTARCEVICPEDMNAANNRATGGFEVTTAAPPRIDVGVSEISSPSGTLGRFDRTPLVVKVKNYGESPATFPVIAKVTPPRGTPYTYTQTVSNLAAGAETEVTFTTRRYSQLGDWQSEAFTDLTGDVNAGNDAANGAFEVRGIQGWCTVGNIPGSPLGAEGAGMVSSGSANYYVLLGKYNPKIYGFNSETDLPLMVGTVPEANAKVGRGTAMAYLGGKVYVLTANKSYTFLSLDLATGGWATLANLPTGPSNRPASTGAALVVVNGNIYAVKGNKTSELYRYNVADNTWTALAGLPDGKFGAGAALCTNGERVFAFTGSSTAFWTYDVTGNAWQSLASLSEKAKAGASLTYLDGIIYATSGSSNSFWSYDLTANRWFALEDVLYDRANKKVKSGASLITLDGILLLEKGAKGTMVYAYEPQGDLYGGPSAKSNVTIKSITPKGELAIVPNPASRVARISVPTTGPVEINVYTTDGRLVKSCGTTECDVSTLANGVYMLKVTANSTTSTLRLVVEH